MNETQEALAGMMFAVQATLRALIASHPNPIRFAAAFHEERETTIVTLLARSNADRSVHACQDFFAGLLP